jgi:hypothetical protein
MFLRLSRRNRSIASFSEVYVSLAYAGPAGASGKSRLQDLGSVAPAPLLSVGLRSFPSARVMCHDITSSVITIPHVGEVLAGTSVDATST